MTLDGRYAGFLLEVENEPAHAHDLLTKADALEDEDTAMQDTTVHSVVQMMTQKSPMTRDLDALDSRNATLIIEGAGASAGIIVSTNAAGATARRVRIGSPS